MSEKHDFGDEYNRLHQEAQDSGYGLLGPFTSSKEQFNKFLDKKNRLEKRILSSIFKKKVHKPNEVSIRELAEYREDYRELIIIDAKMLLATACQKNAVEYLNKEVAYYAEQTYEINHYISYSLPSEGAATAGDKNMGAITIRVKAPKQDASIDDEMEIRFATPEGLILDDLTTEEEVRAWVDSINEIYVLNTEISESESSLSIYRISTDGSMSWPEQIFEKDKIDDLKDQDKRLEADVAEAENLGKLYSKFKELKKYLVPFEFS